MTGTPYTCSSSSLDFMRTSLSRLCSSSSSLSDCCTGNKKSVADKSTTDRQLEQVRNKPELHLQAARSATGISS